jgi:2-polyprenyl-3-methyl-5-hydroxy-6-metoxy-1,4-benzoquinol methylase
MATEQSHRFVAAQPPQATAGSEEISSDRLAAMIEPFDSYWQAPKDIEKGYDSFAAYYRVNYLPWMPADRKARVLVISCGPGYLVDVLVKAGYENVLGIDSMQEKVDFAVRKGLACRTERAFEFLAAPGELFDVIIPEQELNHLTHVEMQQFLRLCRQRLKPGGSLIVYGLNGANPFVGSENLAHNIDHFNTFTEYSLTQILDLAGFEDIEPKPLKVYVFYRNPLNYVGWAITAGFELFFRVMFKLYGKDVKILTKKIAATCRNPAS